MDCEDEYDNCNVIAENNWCDAKGYAGKCCMSCKIAEETKDPDCYDEAQGCVYYKDDMCRPDHYKDQCRKTCGVC